MSVHPRAFPLPDREAKPASTTALLVGLPMPRRLAMEPRDEVPMCAAQRRRSALLSGLVGDAVQPASLLVDLVEHVRAWTPADARRPAARASNSQRRRVAGGIRSRQWWLMSTVSAL